MSETPLSFEEALRRLEEIVAALESGELNLADSLKQFEEGIALARACEAHLLAAEAKIEILTAGELRPWSPPEGATDVDHPADESAGA